MEVFIGIWLLAGAGSFVYDWFTEEDGLREAKTFLPTGEFLINFVLNFLLSLVAGPIFFVYTFYKKWRDNQPFRP